MLFICAQSAEPGASCLDIKFLNPRQEMQAYHFGHDALEWNMPGFTAREFTGIVRWPLYRLCWSVRDLVKTLERRIFCHQTELMNRNDRLALIFDVGL
jgi:hypothetical protein